MKLHHIGIVCKDIHREREQIDKIHQVNSQSDVIFDELQNAELCLFNVDDNINLELVSGPMVEKLVDKGIQYAHLCYEVENLEVSVREFKSKGALVVSAPKPAKLFSMRKVAFMFFPYGLVELIEASHD